MEDLSAIVSRVVNADYGHARAVMPEQPWWDNLERNFHKFPDDFELESIGRIKGLWREVFFGYPNALHESNDGHRVCCNRACTARHPNTREQKCVRC